MKNEANFLHDLRAPLARARTYGKLLAEEVPENSAELMRELMLALDDLEARIRAAESRLPQGD